MTSTTNVTNGTTTHNVDTTNMNIASYQVQLDYQANNTYAQSSQNTTLTVRDGSIHKIGADTDTPWTSDILYGGNKPRIASDKIIHVNYQGSLCVIQIPLDGDFRVTLEMSVDYMGAYGNFGFTTSNNSLNPEIRVYNTTINNTINISNVWNEKNKVETVTFTRIGDTYTYTQNGNTYTTTVANPSTVYFYGQKNGNGSLKIHTMEYQSL